MASGRITKNLLTSRGWPLPNRKSAIDGCRNCWPEPIVPCSSITALPASASKEPSVWYARVRSRLRPSSKRKPLTVCRPGVARRFQSLTAYLALEERQGLDADARLHRAQDLTACEVADSQRALVVIGDQHRLTVLVEGHVHGAPAEVQQGL